MKEVMALKQARMAPPDGGKGDVAARAAWEVCVAACIVCIEDGTWMRPSLIVRFTNKNSLQGRLASLEGRVLSLTHELEAAREEAAAAEDARVVSVKEYERALAGRVSMYVPVVGAIMLCLFLRSLVVCFCGLTHDVHTHIIT